MPFLETVMQIMPTAYWTSGSNGQESEKCEGAICDGDDKIG